MSWLISVPGPLELYFVLKNNFGAHFICDNKKCFIIQFISVRVHVEKSDITVGKQNVAQVIVYIWLTMVLFDLI